MISQGEIYWIQPEDLRPSVEGVPHPHVIIQDDLLNKSRIPTTVVCGLSSQLKKVEEPGNVLLQAGEGGLIQMSVVIISQIASVDKAALGEKVGSLSSERVTQILDGLRFVQRAFFER